MARRLVVEIVGDSRSLERAFQRSTKAGKEMNVAFSGFGKTAAAAGVGFFGAQGLINGIQESVAGASNLQEQISKSDKIFGDASRDVQEWARTTAESFGIANDQALEATGTFGNLFRTVGVSADSSAKMSRSLVELAADLASLNNANPEDVLLALRSGLVGEAEPLRRFGVRLSEVRVQQEAMAETGKKSAKALTEQEKALARYRIILEDTAPAQGDFADTQESFANKTRILKARLREQSTEIGNKLIPVLSRLADATLFAIDAAEGLGDAYKASDIYQDLYDLGGAVHRVADFFGFGTDQVEAYNAALVRVSNTSKQVQADSLAMGGALKEALALKRERFDLSPGFEAEDEMKTFRATAEQRNEWFDAMIGRRRDRVQDIRELEGQITAMQGIARLIERRIAATKDITRKLNLEDELLRVQRDIRGTREAIADRTRRLAEERRAMEQERQERARQLREQRLETQMGWLEFAVERAEATKGIRDDIKAFRAIEDFLEARIRQEGRTLDLVRELWRVQQRIKDASDKTGEDDPLAGLRQASTRQIAAQLGRGTGLTGAGRRRLAFNVSGAQIQLYNSIQVDGREIARAATTGQTRSGKRTAAQTSGRRG